MGEFQRSASKVWWASDEIANWNLHRSVTSSLGSQDSGFSDTEASPKAKDQQRRLGASNKDKTKTQTDNQNLSANVKDKDTTVKSPVLGAAQRPELPPDVYILKTPSKRIEIQVSSEPPVRKYGKKCQKLGGRAYRSMRWELPNKSPECIRNLYAREDADDDRLDSSIDSEVTFDGEASWSTTSDVSSPPERAGSLPASCKRQRNVGKNRSAPEVLNENEERVSISSASPVYSDSDSELERLFAGCLESPNHTSTPKANGFQSREGARSKPKQKMNLMLKYQHERVPPINVQDVEDGTALKTWILECRMVYEPECMLLLQSKSIAADLSEKVSSLASVATSVLRNVMYHSHVLETEFDNLKKTNHILPLAQSLAGLIKEFVKKFAPNQGTPILNQCDRLRNTTPEETNTLVAQLHVDWHRLQQLVIRNEVNKIVDSLEEPKSEIDLRSKLTGLIYVTQKNDALVELFSSTYIIETLVALCTKCEGPSIRALILRALTILCSNADAIRQLERATGVQVIAEVLHDSTFRPEQERSEAVALLAQITAPWIEDNHSIRGLQDHASTLVKALTHFLRTTKCCQNILLCTAALANLTAMDAKCIKYVMHESSVKILLDCLKSRGPLTSVYLLEQVAMLLANISAVEYTRKQLTQDEAPRCLLHFLQVHFGDEEAVKRLQQKAIVALSRLCGDKSAAQQVVDFDGVQKLVLLCREKKERHDNNAVLVATLTTLRKITEYCGVSVISVQDAQELIEPRLLDSFFAYSTQNESLV